MGVRPDDPRRNHEGEAMCAGIDSGIPLVAGGLRFAGRVTNFFAVPCVIDATLPPGVRLYVGDTVNVLRRGRGGSAIPRFDPTTILSMHLDGRVQVPCAMAQRVGLRLPTPKLTPGEADDHAGLADAGVSWTSQRRWKYVPGSRPAKGNPLALWRRGVDPFVLSWLGGYLSCASRPATGTLHYGSHWLATQMLKEVQGIEPAALRTKMMICVTHLAESRPDVFGEREVWRSHTLYVKDADRAAAAIGGLLEAMPQAA